MKAAHAQVYPPTTDAPSRQRLHRRVFAVAAVVVALLTAGALGRYSGDARANNGQTRDPHPEVVVPEPSPQTTATPHTTETSTPTRSPASQIRLDAEAKLGIELDDFNEAEQDFLIALASGGEL